MHHHLKTKIIWFGVGKCYQDHWKKIPILVHIILDNVFKDIRIALFWERWRSFSLEICFMTRSRINLLCPNNVFTVLVTNGIIKDHVSNCTLYLVISNTIAVNGVKLWISFNRRFVSWWNLKRNSLIEWKLIIRFKIKSSSNWFSEENNADRCCSIFIECKPWL